MYLLLVHALGAGCASIQPLTYNMARSARIGTWRLGATQKLDVKPGASLFEIIQSYLHIRG
jgi:hypothetical protein